VNLVGIAESAMGSVKAAEAGDWQAAASQAYSAVNMATKGELGKKAGELLNDATKSADSYLTNLMPDSLNDSVQAVKNALHVDDNKAVQLAVEAVSKRAAVTGISFLNKDENLSRLAGGLGLSQQKRDELSTTLQKESKDAVGNALDEFGQEFRAAAAQKVPQLIGDAPWKDVDWAAVRQSLMSTEHIKIPEGIEATAVGLIAAVHQQLAGVDTSVLKEQLLAARDRVRQKAADLAGTTLDRAGAAIDKLAQDYEKAISGAAATLGLDPPPLPKSVRDGLAAFHTNVDNARNKIAFLVDSDAQSKLIGKLAQSSSRDEFDRNMDSVVTELTNDLGDAKKSMDDADMTGI
jgi:hypothetical protein